MEKQSSFQHFDNRDCCKIRVGLPWTFHKLGWAKPTLAMPRTATHSTGSHVNGTFRVHAMNTWWPNKDSLTAQVSSDLSSACCAASCSLTSPRINNFDWCDIVQGSAVHQPHPIVHSRCPHQLFIFCHDPYLTSQFFPFSFYTFPPRFPFVSFRFFFWNSGILACCCHIQRLPMFRCPRFLVTNFPRLTVIIVLRLSLCQHRFVEFLLL